MLADREAVVLALRSSQMSKRRKATWGQYVRIIAECRVGIIINIPIIVIIIFFFIRFLLRGGEKG